MMRVAALLASAMLFAILPARATETAETYETTLLGEGDLSASSVAFFASCGDECYAATLDCDVTGAVSFEFGDVDAKIAAAAMTSETQDFAITVADASYSFTILNLKYGGEMYGTWLVTGGLPGTSKAPEFAEALGKAANFKATIGSESLTLPVDADVKTWAAACMLRSAVAN